MKSLSLQEKEQEIVTTVYACNNLLGTNEDSSDFVKLYESVTGSTIIDENFNKVKFQDYRKNKLAYFREVNSFLEKTDKTIISSLNESFNIDKQFDLNNFRAILKNKIDELLKSDEFEKLDCLGPEITRIKILNNKPIMVCGFDIIDNFHLKEELSKRFNLEIKNIISIIFEKSNKQIIFVFESILLKYDLLSNDLDYIKDVENSDKIDKTNYIRFIADNISANIIEIYINLKIFDFKFTDNLFFDEKFKEEQEKKDFYRNNNLFVKS